MSQSGFCSKAWLTLCHRPRQQCVVGIQKPEDIPRSALEPFVQAVGGSLVRFKEHRCQPAAKAFDQFAASVRRTGIHHDVFELRVILTQHRGEALLQILPLVK